MTLFDTTRWGGTSRGSNETDGHDALTLGGTPCLYQGKLGCFPGTFPKNQDPSGKRYWHFLRAETAAGRQCNGKTRPMPDLVPEHRLPVNRDFQLGTMSRVAPFSLASVSSTDSTQTGSSCLVARSYAMPSHPHSHILSWTRTMAVNRPTCTSISVPKRDRGQVQVGTVVCTACNDTKPQTTEHLRPTKASFY